MPFIPAAIGGIASAIAGAAAGAAGLVASAASAVGSVASGILGGAASAVGGLLGLGGAAAEQAAVPVLVGGEMGSLAAVSEAAALGVPAATTGVATGLSALTSAVSAGVGIYGQLAQIEAAKEMSEAQKIAAQKGLIEAEAVKLYAAAPATAPAAAQAPTLSSQPVYVTPAVTPAKPNYLLYAGLAVLVIIFLRKK